MKLFVQNHSHGISPILKYVLSYGSNNLLKTNG